MVRLELDCYFADFERRTKTKTWGKEDPVFACSHLVPSFQSRSLSSPMVEIERFPFGAKEGGKRSTRWDYVGIDKR